MPRLVDTLHLVFLLAALGLASAAGDALAHGGHQHPAASEAVEEQRAADAPLQQRATISPGAAHQHSPAVTVSRHCPSGPGLGCHCGKALWVGAQSPALAGRTLPVALSRFPGVSEPPPSAASPRRTLVLTFAPPRAPPFFSA